MIEGVGNEFAEFAIVRPAQKRSFDECPKIIVRKRFPGKSDYLELPRQHSLRVQVKERSRELLLKEVSGRTENDYSEWFYGHREHSTIFAATKKATTPLVLTRSQRNIYTKCRR